MTRFNYRFNSGMCWECKSHRTIPAAQAQATDWENLVIAFEQKEIFKNGGENELIDFLKSLSTILGINFVDVPPRKNPYANPTKSTLAIFGISEQEAQFAGMVGADQDDEWREDMWICVEVNSIFNQGCSTPSCLENDGTSIRGRWRDIAIHAPSFICDALLGCLYDFNHGASKDIVIAKANFEAMVRMKG